MKHRRVNCNNISENFDEKEWKNTLKKAHDFAICESDKVKQQIENIIKDIDPVELLSHISLLSQFIPEGEPELNQDLRDKPTLHFLAGLCLKSENLDYRTIRQVFYFLFTGYYFSKCEKGACFRS
jgi:hypothetical protein